MRIFRVFFWLLSPTLLLSSSLLFLLCNVSHASDTATTTTMAGTTTATSSKESIGWLVEDFPSPMEIIQVEEGSKQQEQQQQQQRSYAVADPDGILNDNDLMKLNEKIRDLDSTTLSVSVPDEESSVSIQIAIAIVEKMNLKDFETGQEEAAAEYFCRRLHDTWGVGHETKIGGTGVVIFLSVYDRVIYISKGAALEKILGNSRIEKIISTVRPSLTQVKYAEGLTEAVDAIVGYCTKGEPDWTERFFEFLEGPYLFIIFWCGLLFNGLFASYLQRQKDRAYAQAQSQLSELDRARAEALQGQYQATSCPICLENFISSTVGSDQQPIKLLRCGHVFDESCWSEWVTSGQGTITKCPICQKDIGATEENQTEQVQVIQQQIIEHDHRDQDRVVQRFQQERNFRLMRMAVRYPNFINNHQIQRWTSPTYNGDLARDPTFVSNNPRVVSRSTGGSRAGGGGGISGGSMSFGGGRSSGGAGGRF